MDADTRLLEEASVDAIEGLWRVVRTRSSWETTQGIRAAKIILDLRFKKAKLFDVGRRPAGLKRAVPARKRGQRGDSTGESPNPVTEESAAAPPGAGPDHTLPVPKSPLTGIESNTNARQGSDEPAKGGRLRRIKPGDESGARKATQCDAPGGDTPRPSGKQVTADVQKTDDGGRGVVRKLHTHEPAPAPATAELVVEGTAQASSGPQVTADVQMKSDSGDSAEKAATRQQMLRERGLA